MSLDTRVIMLPALIKEGYCKYHSTVMGAEVFVINLKQPLLDPKLNRIVRNQNSLWAVSKFEKENYFKPIHFYIITNEKIVQGDWVKVFWYGPRYIFGEIVCLEIDCEFIVRFPSFIFEELENTAEIESELIDYNMLRRYFIGENIIGGPTSIIPNSKENKESKYLWYRYDENLVKLVESFTLELTIMKINDELNKTK